MGTLHEYDHYEMKERALHLYTQEFPQFAQYHLTTQLLVDFDGNGYYCVMCACCNHEKDYSFTECAMVDEIWYATSDNNFVVDVNKHEIATREEFDERTMIFDTLHDAMKHFNELGWRVLGNLKYHRIFV